MSRFYEMQFEFGSKEHPIEATHENVDRLSEIVSDIWSADDVLGIPDIGISIEGSDHLVRGETEEAFFERAKKHIWASWGDFIPITIIATCLDYIPRTTFTTTEEDYLDWVGEKEQSRVR